ncbi:MAG TPA: hypothetical protein VFE08_14560 [Candidatus Sulfotelmatobacter sp.]|jgi:hypothetical protein|nr:hypothetical protein [Candidatus Sulfotelmatobacter sp.]
MATGFNPSDYQPDQLEEIEHVLGTLDGDVFRNSETGEVVILTDGGNYIISVAVNGETSSTYATVGPLEDFLGPKENEHVLTDVAEIKGWDAGWET